MVILLYPIINPYNNLNLLFTLTYQLFNTTNTKSPMFSDYMSFLRNMQRCSSEASRIHSLLAASLPPHCVLQPIASVGYCFQIHFTNGPVHGISVSIPPDCNRSGSFLYETALVDASGDLVYIPHLGYDDIDRFSSIPELLAEILRMATAPVHAPHATSAPLDSDHYHHPTDDSGYDSPS